MGLFALAVSILGVRDADCFVRIDLPLLAAANAKALPTARSAVVAAGGVGSLAGGGSNGLIRRPARFIRRRLEPREKAVAKQIAREKERQLLLEANGFSHACL